jgi:hypothetical protein
MNDVHDCAYTLTLGGKNHVTFTLFVGGVVKFSKLLHPNGKAVPRFFIQTGDLPVVYEKGYSLGCLYGGKSRLEWPRELKFVFIAVSYHRYLSEIYGPVFFYLMTSI